MQVRKCYNCDDWRVSLYYCNKHKRCAKPEGMCASHNNIVFDNHEAVNKLEEI